MRNIRIKYVHLPGNIRACVVKCFDESDWFTIFVNSSLCETAQHKALMHELDHIKKDDFSSIISVTDLEEICHEKRRYDN